MTNNETIVLIVLIVCVTAYHLGSRYFETKYFETK
jgi:H+/Cl- antiporter ClcA